VSKRKLVKIPTTPLATISTKHGDTVIYNVWGAMAVICIQVIRVIPFVVAALALYTRYLYI